MATDWTQNARVLKLVVTGLGIAIVVAATGLAVALVKRGARAPERAAAPPIAASAPLATGVVALPGGGRALAMTGDGDRLSLLIEGADGRQRIVTLDRRTGLVLGTLTLAPVEGGE